MARIAFAGIGNMGWPMAANLIKAGHDVVVSDLSAERVARFVSEVGGSGAASAAEAASGADALVTILPTSREVAVVATQVADFLPNGALFIDMTSGNPTRTREIAESLAPRGIRMVDCPVSGGVPRAKTGELAIMAGGSDTDLDAAEPILRAMGTSIHRCGAIGAGQAMKALNNLVSAGGFLIGIEALLIGQKFGLEPGLMVDVLNASTGMNNSTQKKFRQFVLSRRFDSGFGLDLMVKDLSIALEVGKEAGVPTPLSALTREMWAAAAKSLGAGEDHTAVAKLSENLSGQVLTGGNG
ncbi:NAD(P)-dependent oxidoreductase [Roseococcus suduntuyensis]|uniref:3-hydroxyisobutyrate dehydrogenase n=1 Tax=Roseococcus suduntuyensis TaxID=455361 RepID=A0A840A486_9PROT|nr:NAD(P)-dependent oxidoreductase [Roseococcus suduntuyensis]MBB3896758.1 3-hydroxyisobutyrate dehydrogenase [Roseococcus suduntuyensis]